MDGRRKLSISRSGRMKQANRKRHSLSLDLYGENGQNTCSTEKPKVIQDNGPTSAPADIEGDRQNRRRSADDYNEPKVIHSKTVDVVANSGSQSKHRRLSVEPKSPEEEIDSAFEIIDKS
ncbi:uncharacterized protein LOC115442820 [Manduca sexta]|nr:uncharacterized protein LOC115442820 [Manduca sexta]XP_037296061.1 uncharacterized protein LOC115442820 [Manduca sexta]